MKFRTRVSSILETFRIDTNNVSVAKRNQAFNEALSEIEAAHRAEVERERRNEIEERARVLNDLLDPKELSKMTERVVGYRNQALAELNRADFELTQLSSGGKGGGEDDASRGSNGE